jgi:hypothetical protein
VVKQLAAKPIPLTSNPAAGELQPSPITTGKGHTMSGKTKFSAKSARRTSIADLSEVGNELPDDHLRLVSGGAPNSGRIVIIVCRTRYPNSSTACGDNDYADD